MRKFLGLVVLGLCGVVGAQAPAAKTPAPVAGLKVQATPAMWKVKGVKGTVYLFGSVHVMKPDVVWETAKVKDALGASDTVYLEVKDVDPEAMKAMQPLIMKIGMDMEHPLSTKISKEDVGLMDAEVKKLGLPGEQAFEPMRPWMAYVTLSVLPAIQAGYSPDGGIDVRVSSEAGAAGKPVKGFETAEDQLHYLADMPEAEQVKMLHKSLEDMPKAGAEMDAMVADWTRGDVEKIAARENDEMKTKYPELYATLLVKRNEKFADAIAGMLKDPATGTVFVTIGAAHLAGPDSVQKMLEKKGFKAERVE